MSLTWRILLAKPELLPSLLVQLLDLKVRWQRYDEQVIRLTRILYSSRKCDVVMFSMITLKDSPVRTARSITQV